MKQKKITFSPVTRLSGLLSIDMVVDKGKIIDAKARSTMFRGFEWIMRNRYVDDAVYMTQRVCGICSLAHGAVGSYLLDELYDNTISENAQLLRNIMYSADFLQNHIRHFYLFSLPDFVKMPEQPPWLGQELRDARLGTKNNQEMVDHYYAGVKAAQESHQLLTLFGGKAPHQHSFLDGGVTSAPTADKIASAISLIDNIHDFVGTCMIRDTQLLARIYSDYYMIGTNPARMISFGLFRFGENNQKYLWPAGVMINERINRPDLSLIRESIPHSYFDIGQQEEINTPDDIVINQQGEMSTLEDVFKNQQYGINLQKGVIPDPEKEGAYSWAKTVHYSGMPFETGPLSRAVIRGELNERPSTMGRMVARSLEALKITELVKGWLCELKPGPPPFKQNKVPVKDNVTATTDAMRGALLHSVEIEEKRAKYYNIITPTAWNFSPTDESGVPGPVESALIGTEIPHSDDLYTITGRIIRSFDPCISCATHVYNNSGDLQKEYIF